MNARTNLRMAAGRAAVEAFKSCGTDAIFGLMGSSTLDLYDALYDNPQIRYIGVRDERAGAHMADAYARITGRPGVMIAGQSGPGATNLVTGLAQAKLAYSPMLVIAGLPLTGHIGKDAFQEVDQNTLFLAVSKKVINVPSAQRIPELIGEGMQIAVAGRGGPVVLNIPRDLFAQEIDFKPASKPGTVVSAGHLSPSQMSEVVTLLKVAKAPVIVAGGGIKWARGQDAVIALAEALDIPMVASSGHADVVPSDHPLFFGYAGPAPYGNPVARKAVHEADLIIVLGSRLGFNTTLFGNDVVASGTPIVQADIDADAIGKYYPVRFGVVGNPAAFAEGLREAWVAAGKNRSWKNRLPELTGLRTELWANREAKAERSTASPLRPEPVFAALRKALPRDTLLALDSGTLCRQAADMLNYYEPPALLTPLDFALVGFGFAAGLGAKVAAPERTVVSISGDGGFGMTMIDIATAVQSRIKTVAIVLDNDCWGSEKAYQRDFYDGRYIGDSIVNPRFDLTAKSVGADGAFVTEAEEIAPAIEKALRAETTFVIQIKIDPDATVSSRKDALQHRLKT